MELVTAPEYLINSMALVRERTIPTERPPPVGEVSAHTLMHLMNVAQLLRTSAYLVTPVLWPVLFRHTNPSNRCDKSCSDTLIRPNLEARPVQTH
jgi:hypothetical protein